MVPSGGRASALVNGPGGLPAKAARKMSGKVESQRAQVRGEHSSRGTSKCKGPEAEGTHGTAGVV